MVRQSPTSLHIALSIINLAPTWGRVQMNFELLPGYIKAMKQLNLDSVIGYSHDSEKSIRHVHVFPCFMNAVLKFVRPVISLDAARLKSISKETMYVSSVLSGTNEVYPIILLISAGNEDGETWTTMLNFLKEARPIISKQGCSNECDDGSRFCLFLTATRVWSGPSKCISKK